jgi:hypothetical protein
MSGARFAWRGLGVVIAAAAGLAFRAGTAYELDGPEGGAAVLRLSWSARPERVERCRRLTDEELQTRPAHMRLRVECHGAFARYHLSVSVDGRAIAGDTIRGGGLRHDRPMHVFEEIPVPAGARAVRISLVRLDSTVATAVEDPAAVGADTLLGARESREADERRRRAQEAIPPELVLDTILSLVPRGVVLVTYDGGRRRLVVQGGPVP